MSIDCVILAAGLSSRMGTNKMLLDIGGITVIESCIHAFYEACSKIIVVTGRYHEDIRRCLAAYPKAHIVYNGDYRQGMFSSVKIGVRNTKAKRLFITPGDYPFLKAETIRRLANASGNIISPVYKGRQGHPVLLDQLFTPLILNSASPSLRDCLGALAAGRQRIHVDDIGVVTDIDTIEEYKAAVLAQSLKIKHPNIN